MAFVAFLDACVLVPPTLRDVILTIAEAGLCQIRWSPDVLDEVERNVAKNARNSTRSSDIAESGARYLRETMERAFPDAMFEQERYASLIPSMTNHEKDRHVLAAAIVSRADVLVTANLRDFHDQSPTYHIDVQHPDDFLQYQFELSPQSFLYSLEQLSVDRHYPMNSVPAILATLQKVTPQFSQMALQRWTEKSSV